MIETTWELCSHHSNSGFNLVLLSRNDTAFIVAISGCPWSTDKLISVCLQLGSQGVYPLLTPNTKERYWLFGGSCGLTPRRRRQPSSGATCAESVFPTKREGPARGRRRHAMAVEALVPPGAAQVAIRIATRVATVYTNAPKRHREVISTNLCTLLPHRPGGEARPTGAVTQPPTHTNSRSLMYEHHPVRAGPLSGSGHPQPTHKLNTRHRRTRMLNSHACLHTCRRRALTPGSHGRARFAGVTSCSATPRAVPTHGGAHPPRRQGARNSRESS